MCDVLNKRRLDLNTETVSASLILVGGLGGDKGGLLFFGSFVPKLFLQRWVILQEHNQHVDLQKFGEEKRQVTTLRMYFLYLYFLILRLHIRAWLIYVCGFSVQEATAAIPEDSPSESK